MIKKSPHTNVENSGNILETLTDIEKEIYTYLCKGLTPQQIINKRKRKGIKSKESTYRPLRKLKKLGVVGHGYNLVENIGGGSPQSPQKKLRLHGQQFSINIIDSDERYKKFLKTCNSRIINNNTVMFYRDKLIVYGVTSFYGDTVSECMNKSTTFWNRFLRILENDYNLILIKPRQNNIYFFNQHWAEVGNELARDYNDNCQKLQVRTNDDGKVWLLVDNSFNLNELETTHPKTSTFDIEKVTNYFNNIRDNKDLLLPKELQNMVFAQTSLISEQSKTISNLIKLNEEQILFNKQQQELQNENLLLMRGLIGEIEKLKRK